MKINQSIICFVGQKSKFVNEDLLKKTKISPPWRVSMSRSAEVLPDGKAGLRRINNIRYGPSTL
ncbi:MAG: hypothetical protein B6230_06835 [Desulfobacteraceae bacterium 4572_89]|nr:MAG: hypothetical protein B6230_06835 [Desulfobacteraceae bacterium 4572_89]